MRLFSGAKINLSLDVTGKLPSGMHTVDMVMQQLTFGDRIDVRLEEGREELAIDLSTNKPYLPRDERNLAYKAARIMGERYGLVGRLHIRIAKRIPVAAGLAGGSGNGAAVLHGINALYELGLSLGELCEIGKELGSDVPFCVGAQAVSNQNLPEKIRRDPLASACARARGTGTELTQVPPLKYAVLLAKPRISVSTAQVYGGIDECRIEERPDNHRLERALREKNYEDAKAQMINVLENYTLKEEKSVEILKEFMKELEGAEKVLMSGSGPTVFALMRDRKSAEEGADALRKMGYEAHSTRTTL